MPKRLMGASTVSMTRANWLQNFFFRLAAASSSPPSLSLRHLWLSRLRQLACSTADVAGSKLRTDRGVALNFLEGFRSTAHQFPLTTSHLKQFTSSAQPLPAKRAAEAAGKLSNAAFSSGIFLNHIHPAR